MSVMSSQITDTANVCMKVAIASRVHLSESDARLILLAWEMRDVRPAVWWFLRLRYRLSVSCLGELESH